MLVEPKSEEENAKITALAKDKDVEIFWIGINDITNEGVFTYDSDGKNISWTNWDSGEPNNYKDKEDCTQIRWKNSGKWNDVRCADSYHMNSFVCKNTGTKMNQILRLQEGKFPEVFWYGRWTPICGHCFCQTE